MVVIEDTSDSVGHEQDENGVDYAGFRKGRVDFHHSS